MNKPLVQRTGPFKMRTVSRLTGFSPALLRAWERRHNLLYPLRGPGGHRLYTEEDLQVLLRIRELARQGRSIGEIAAFGREALLREGAELLQEQIEPVTLEAHPLAPEALDALSEHCGRIVDATLAMDAAAIHSVLDEGFDRVSPEAVIFQVIEPATLRIGDLWAAGRCSIAAEHLATGVFVRRLLRLIESAEPLRSDHRPVIVACFPDEYHQLGALVVAYQLCRHGLRVSFLGAALPFEDLEGACDVLRPSAILLSATRPAVFQVHRRGLLGAARRAGRNLPVFIGGQGAPTDDPQLAQFGVHAAPPADNSWESLGALADQIRNRDARA